MLRQMRWWDVAAVVPVERELFGATAWSAATFWSELAHPENRWYVVAESGTELVGYAGLMVSGAEADVQTVAVAPGAQGRGIGSLLLRALVGEASLRGATAVLLEVRADNAPAIALYQRHGFTRIAIRRGYYQPGGIDAWIMRLRPIGPVERPDGWCCPPAG
ncbi:MAG: ribosomal protein S18-alanine N-acetyltransferase [Actinomycetales bacterium]|nr:ribosomal protein S18-alanine N-acetyltransferase [Actinomycetales bacterium]